MVLNLTLSFLKFCLANGVIYTQRETMTRVCKNTYSSTVEERYLSQNIVQLDSSKARISKQTSSLNKNVT